MRRVKFFGRVIFIAMFFVCFVGIAYLGFQRDDEPIAFTLTFSCLFVAVIAAVCLIAWIINRRERDAFVASLTDAERVGLHGFEVLRGWGSWRDFSELVAIERDAARQSATLYQE